MRNLHVASIRLIVSYARVGDSEEPTCSKQDSEEPTCSKQDSEEPTCSKHYYTSG